MLITQNLEIITPIPIHIVENLTIDIQPNNHAKCKVSGILAEENSIDYTYEYKENIDVIIKSEKKIIFRGFIEELRLKKSANITYFKFDSYSYSKKIDEEKKRELFQNTSQRYGDTVKKLLNQYMGDLNIYVDDRNIEKPLLCYDETIWEFSKYVALSLGTYVYPNIVANNPSINLGIKSGTYVDYSDIELKESIISRCKNGKEIKKHKIASYKAYDIGDCIKIGREEFVIISESIEFINYELKFTFTVIKRRDIEDSINTYENENIIGLSLKGRVIRVDKEKIYISTDIITDSPSYSFDWYPETGNVMYAMPEIGETVELYIYDSGRGKMYALRSLYNDGKDANNKLLKTIQNKSISLSDSGVTFKSDDHMLINDSFFRIIGNRGITINAKESIVLNAANIIIKSEEEIIYINE